MQTIEEGDIEVIDLWEDGDGNQDVWLYKRPALKVLKELHSDEQLAGQQHFGFNFQAVQELTRFPRSGLQC